MDARPFLLATIGLLLALFGPTRAVAQDDNHTVRVRLLDGDKVMHTELRAVDGTLRLTTDTDDNTLARIDPDEEATIGIRDDEVYLRLGQGGLYTEALHVHPGTDARWSITLHDETERTYDGTLIVRPDSADPEALQLVNEVPLEDYVAGVVASEYTLDDEEGMKAMAVVARTYALRASIASDAYEHVDHVGSQMYRGPSAITPEARAAAEATRGEILTHDGQVIQAVYSASSGGHTANHEDVWDADRSLPYLRGKHDPYDASSPHAHWRASIPRDVLLQALSDHYGMEVEGFHLGDRSPDGRVQTIELQAANGDNRRVQSNEFRLFVNDRIPGVNLKSTLFEARRDGNRYIVEGRGYGHGVGLSQWGAHEMARRGHGYRDILAFYYTDVTLTSLDEVEPDNLTPATPVASTEDEPAESTNTRRRIGW